MVDSQVDINKRTYCPVATQMLKVKPVFSVLWVDQNMEGRVKQPSRKISRDTVLLLKVCFVSLVKICMSL